MATPQEERPLLDDLALLARLFASVLQHLVAPQVAVRLERLLAVAASAPTETPGAVMPEVAHDRIKAEVLDILTSCPHDHIADVLRACAESFSLINLAERVHRLRRRSASLVPGAVPQQGSLMEVAQAARTAGVSADDALTEAQKLRLEPVFTAHPTEATRGSLLRKEQRMAQLLLAPPPGDGHHRGGHDRTPWHDALKAEMAAAWQTETLTDAPTVADEVEHVTFYLTEVIYPTVPHFFDGLRTALENAYGPQVAARYGSQAEAMGPQVRFGTWVGGDMDGNPNVGPDTIDGTLSSQRRALIGAYDKDLAGLYDRLSHSATRTWVSHELLARLAQCDHETPEVTAPMRHRGMPYRRLLLHMRARLAPNRAASYRSGEALRQDLQLMAQSLEAHGGIYSGAFAVRRVMRRVAAFGLHLAALDVRQDSVVHRAAAAALLGDAALADMPAAARAERFGQALNEVMAGAPPWPAATLDAAREHVSLPLGRMLAVFGAIKTAQREFGAPAIGLYIISMAQQVDDLLAVLLLAHAADLRAQNSAGVWHVPLQVAPLFETVPDLAAAPDVLSAACAHPVWRAHLTAQGGVQNIMLGYSDSNKESGFVASRAALLTAETALVATAQAQNIIVRLFHGRGGTLSRGGSKPRQAILASHTPSSDLRITEQGEIIHAKYGLGPQVLRTLEIMGGALWQRALLPQKEGAQAPGWQEALHTCAQASRAAYHRLVHESPDFFGFFNLATPIDVIIRLRIGSRPPSRRTAQGLGDLRAIPWVFAWMQNRHMLPGWYGLGHGLQAVMDTHGPEALQEMYRAWPFFKNLIDDAAVTLAKCDMDVGAQYAALAGEAHAPLWQSIASSYAETCAQVMQITQTQELLHHEPVLARGIARRNPQVAPMHHLQVALLARWRAGGRTDDSQLRLLMLSVKGVAKGLHNTG